MSNVDELIERLEELSNFFSTPELAKNYGSVIAKAAQALRDQQAEIERLKKRPTIAKCIDSASAILEDEAPLTTSEVLALRDLLEAQ